MIVKLVLDVCCFSPKNIFISMPRNHGVDFMLMQDPVRSFVGREKYKRPLWATDALENPSVVRLCTAIISL